MRKAAPKDEEKKETPVEEEKKDSPAQDTEPPADKPKEEPASGEEKPKEEKESKEEPAGEKEEAPDKPEEEKASDDAQADENGEGAQEAPEKADSGEADPPKEEPAAAAGETEQLKKELADARAQLCALRLGVLPEMAQDAVSLAIVQAGENYQEEGLEKAMNEVLKRHPDWKSDKKNQAGGFKLGADPEKAASKASAKKSGSAEGKTKRWNRFKK